MSYLLPAIIFALLILIAIKLHAEILSHLLSMGDEFDDLWFVKKDKVVVEPINHQAASAIAIEVHHILQGNKRDVEFEDTYVLHFQH